MYYQELLGHKLYDGDAKHTIFICICKFSLPRKATIIHVTSTMIHEASGIK